MSYFSSNTSHHCNSFLADHLYSATNPLPWFVPTKVHHQCQQNTFLNVIPPAHKLFEHVDRGLVSQLSLWCVTATDDISVDNISHLLNLSSPEATTTNSQHTPSSVFLVNYQCITEKSCASCNFLLRGPQCFPSHFIQLVDSLLTHSYNDNASCVLACTG